ncbi:MAG: leucyl aminopeptidase family protein [Bacteroidales bacterium]
MIPGISLLTKETGKENMAILVDRNKKTKFPFLSSAEQKYVDAQMENKQDIIRVNQYRRLIFLCPVEQKNSESQMLEFSRLAGAKLQSVLQEERVENLLVLHWHDKKPELLAFAEGLALASYRFNKYKSAPEEKQNMLKTIALKHPHLNKEEIAEMNVLLDAVFRARDLVNEPVSHLNAVQLASEIEKMGKEAGFAVEVFHKARIESLRMGGLLAVNKGSVDPPTFTVMEWKPMNARNKKPVVLVGKGIVYDTGGLSLKPTPDSMDYMKSDMSGAAAVAAVIYALALNKIPVHVVGLVPATDNRPGGNAFAPGDIITMYDKTRVEMLNSDAEGRMILADALAYAKAYKPALGITIATLTGAAARALGKFGMAGMGTAPEKIMQKLTACGEKVYERIAWFPFWDEYSELLRSEIADIKNIGGNEAGAITAGKFLARFTSYPFVHLDIAGVAWAKTTEGYRIAGGTGTGVRLLYEFLKNY